MSWWNKIIRKSDKDQFAERLMKALQAAGDPRTASYDPDEFCLRFWENGQEQGLLNLNNLFIEYSQVERQQREQCLNRIVRAALSHLKEIPDEFRDAAHDLWPRLWARSTFEQIRLQQRLNGSEPLQYPLEPIGEHLTLSLVYDLPEAVRSISTDDLEAWGVTYWQAREVALQQLAESDFQIVSLGGELHASSTGDSYDATRMILIDLIHQLDIAGQPIAMVPNRDTLLITGSESEVGQKMMLELAQKTLAEQPRPLTATPLILDQDEQWIDWDPPPENPLYQHYRELKLGWLASEYADQQKLLLAIHQQEHVPLGVADFSALQTDGQMLSYSIWGRGAPTLLPETDLIALIPSPQATGDQIRMIPAEQVRNELSDLMKEIDCYPTRWEVTEFPSEQRLKRLKPIEMKP